MTTITLKVKFNLGTKVYLLADPERVGFVVSVTVVRGNQYYYNVTWDTLENICHEEFELTDVKDFA